MLAGRHKDGVKVQRKLFRIAHAEDSYQRRLDELLGLRAPGERIYASASPRDIKKASRIFRERQMTSEYDADPMDFYRNLEKRWVSTLMDPRSVCDDGRLWMLDADTPEEIEAALAVVGPITALCEAQGRDASGIYSYKTKNGLHVLIPPVDRRELNTVAMLTLKADAMILLAY